MSERIQKLISGAGYCSRRAAEALITEGRVSVNGQKAVLGESAEARDLIEIDGKALPRGGERTYIILNKPRGYVTTMSDERGRKTVSELVRGAGGRLYPVGRLDMDSEGLLVMTDDGQLANMLMHPSHEVSKTYLVRVRGQVLEEGLQRLREPVTLDGKSVRAEKVVLKESGDDSSLLSITIKQGLNRQIRRMCDASGLKVLRLKRVAEGPIKLGQLPQGQWRHLTEKEVQELKKL